MNEKLAKCLQVLIDHEDAIRHQTQQTQKHGQHIPSEFEFSAFVAVQQLHQLNSGWKLLSIEGELQITHREGDFVFFVQVLFVLGVAELFFMAQPYLGLAYFVEGPVCLGHCKSNFRGRLALIQ
jgi:hypothetical protein